MINRFENYTKAIVSVVSIRSYFFWEKIPSFDENHIIAEHLQSSILGKERDDRISIEFESTEINTIRNVKMKQSIAYKQPKVNKILDLYEEYQEYGNEVNFDTVVEIVKTLSNKFKEYIIDEDEAEVIRRLVKIVTENHELHLSDHLDLVYKYARLYFKILDKQYYSEPEANFKEESKEDVKDSSSNSKIYEEVTHWLLDGIERVLSTCDGDVTQLDGYFKKLFLLTASMYIVSRKFPHKYGVQSKNSGQIPDKNDTISVEELESKLIDCILAIKYKGNILWN